MTTPGFGGGLLGFRNPGIVVANQVIIFGSNGGLFVYSGTPALGNLIASIAATSGTDPYGNAYIGGGLASYGGGFTNFLGLVSGVPELQFKTGQPDEQTAGNIAGGVVGSGGTQQLQLLMSGPQTNVVGARDWAQLYLISNDAAGTLNAEGQLRYVQDGGTIVESLRWNNDGVGISNRSSVPNSSATDQKLYGWQGQLKYVSSDTNAYNTGHNVNFLASAFPFSSTTPVNITGMSVAVSPTVESYLVSGIIIVNQGGVTANQAIRFTGPATSLVAISYNCFEGTGVFSSGVQTAMNADIGTGSVPNGTVGELHFKGMMTFSAAGTLQMTGRCATASADTWSAGVGSFMKVEPVS